MKRIIMLIFLCVFIFNCHKEVDDNFLKQWRNSKYGYFTIRVTNRDAIDYFAKVSKAVLLKRNRQKKLMANTKETYYRLMCKNLVYPKAELQYLKNPIKISEQQKDLLAFLLKKHNLLKDNLNKNLLNYYMFSIRYRRMLIKEEYSQKLLFKKVTVFYYDKSNLYIYYYENKAKINDDCYDGLNDIKRARNIFCYKIKIKNNSLKLSTIQKDKNLIFKLKKMKYNISGFRTFVKLLSFKKQKNKVMINKSYIRFITNKMFSSNILRKIISDEHICELINLVYSKFSSSYFTRIKITDMNVFPYVSYFIFFEFDENKYYFNIIKAHDSLYVRHFTPDKRANLISRWIFLRPSCAYEYLSRTYMPEKDIPISRKLIVLSLNKMGKITKIQKYKKEDIRRVINIFGAPKEYIKCYNKLLKKHKKPIYFRRY